MSILQAIVLGLVQGLTEFIPVSSSGHLLLLHSAFGTTGNSLAFDVALHLGTLVALLLFFYKDLFDLLLGILGKKKSHQHLAWLLVLATIPAVIAGALLQDAAESTFRSATLVSCAMIVMAVVMLLADRFYKTQQTHTALEKVDTKQAAMMGVAQAVALIPGVSRSGVTITTGLFAGLDRVAATRFSFLLAIPITAGAILKVMTSSEGLHAISQTPVPFVVGMVTALLSGLFAIRFMLRYLAKHSLAFFAYYRIVLASFALLIILFH